MKKLIFLLFDILFINAFFRQLNRNKVIIVMYHGVCEDSFTLLKDYDERHVYKSCFRKQLNYIKRKGYSFITISELVAYIRNKNKIKKKVILTFDDGFNNVVKNAYPIMKELGAKGCFYLVSDFVDSNDLLWTDFIETAIRALPTGEFVFVYKGENYTYKLDVKKSYENAMRDIKVKLKTIPDKERLEHLKQFESIRIDKKPEEFIAASWEAVKNLDKNILEIGSHTKSHSNCRHLASDAEFKKELMESKEMIEENIGCPVKHFSYPAGSYSYNEKVIEKLTEYGYDSGVTTFRGLNDINSDLFRLNRVGASNDFSLFKAEFSSSYALFEKIKNIFYKN